MALSLGTLRLFVLRNTKNQNCILEHLDVILRVLVNNCKGLDGQEPQKDDDAPGLEKPEPPKSSEWMLEDGTLQGWEFDGVDLIDMVEAHAVDLLCEIFVENTPACDQAALHPTLFETMRDLCLRRSGNLRFSDLGGGGAPPDIRCLRFFHIVSAYGTPGR